MSAELSGTTGGEEHSQSPAQAGRDVSPSLSPGKGAAAAGATAGGRRGPEESALPFPRKTTLGAVIAQPLHNFDPRCVPWEPEPRPEGVGKEAGNVLPAHAGGGLKVRERQLALLPHHPRPRPLST